MGHDISSIASAARQSMSAFDPKRTFLFEHVSSLLDLSLNFLVSPFKFFIGGVLDRRHLIVRAFHRHDQL